MGKEACWGYLLWQGLGVYFGFNGGQAFVWPTDPDCSTITVTYWLRPFTSGLCSLGPAEGPAFIVLRIGLQVVHSVQASH